MSSDTAPSASSSSPGTLPGPRLDIDARLVEESVELAMRSRPSSAYWAERSKIYGIEDEDERNGAFFDLNLRHFEALHLGAPIRRALDEQPTIAEAVSVCRVLLAISRRQEGAELFAADGGRTQVDGLPERSLVLRLGAATIGEPEVLTAFLRHELFHIADMLDPAFGYDPCPPDLEGGSARLQLVLSRYRVLWDTVIDGRLWRARRVSSEVSSRRREEFASAFSLLGDRLEEAFETLFEEVTPSHEQLMRSARNPGILVASDRTEDASGTCPLCRGPWPKGARRQADLPAILLDEILRDFPRWRPAEGICSQCRDLYRSRPLSRAAAEQLPGS